MTAACGAILVVCNPLLYVRQVTAVRTALTPNVQSLHYLVTDTAEGVLRGVTPVAQPADALERFTALAAVRVDASRLLVELVY